MKDAKASIETIIERGWFERKPPPEESTLVYKA